jgi:hypothetical protein
MLPEKDLVAAQRATWWAQKFALLEILWAFQEEEAEMEPTVFMMREEILQFWVIDGLCKAEMTTCESPSKIKGSRWWDEAIETANLAARASP